MIQQKKKFTLSRKAWIAVILLASLLVLIGADIAIRAIQKPDDGDGTTDTTPAIPPIEGESANNRIYEVSNYDYIEVGQVKITAGDSVYSLIKASKNSEFILSYRDETGQDVTYSPAITYKDKGFSYADLYATQSFGQAQVPVIYYLLNAVGNVAFNQRIPMKTDEEEKAAQLKLYGFGEEDKMYSFDYMYRSSKDGKVYHHAVKIGTSTITGTGYYLLVGDYRGTATTPEWRPYIYVTSTNSITYAMQPFAFYVRPSLIAPGLSADGAYEPYMATYFREWINKVVSEPGTRLTADGLKNATLVVTATRLFSSGAGEDGYDRTEAAQYAFDLAAYGDNADYQRLIRALTDRMLGSLGEDPVQFTAEIRNSDSKLLEFGEAESLSYEYRVIAVEGILTDDGETIRPGTAVGTANLLRVSYYGYKNGERQSENPMHALLDLTDPHLDAATVSALRAMTIAGPRTEADAVAFTVTYTKENATSNRMRMEVTEIFSVTDAEGNYTGDVTEDCYLNVRVNIYIDDVLSSTVTGTLSLSDMLFTDGANLTFIIDSEAKSEFIGIRKATGLQIVIAKTTWYYELMRDFASFEISSLDRTITGEEIVAFGFANERDRDPFYGETVFINKLPKEHRRGLYAIDGASAQSVTRILGGLQSDSTASSGLTGSETVAVGITPAVMAKYELYAHTVYYELPRGIYHDPNAEEDEQDYAWQETLGFTLYVSKEQPDGTRYVGCDMYDVVVKIDADIFWFLDYTFEEFWARKTLISTDIKNVQAMDVKMNTSTVHGEFRFDLTHNEYTSGGSTYNRTSVSVTPGDFGSATRLQEYMTAHGMTSVGMNEFYREVGGLNLYGNNYAGSGYFTTFIRMLYLTSYVGTVPEEEREAFLATEPLMTLTFTVKQSSYRYVFEFYRGSDRQVLVQVKHVTSEGKLIGVVNDFYISTLGFKKLVNAMDALLDARALASDAEYGD